MSIEEIRKRWEGHAAWARSADDAKADIHAILAAVDALTAERDAAQARVKELEAALRPFTRLLCYDRSGPMTRHERELNDAYEVALRVLDPHRNTTQDKEAKPDG